MGIEHHEVIKPLKSSICTIYLNNQDSLVQQSVMEPVTQLYYSNRTFTWNNFNVILKPAKAEDQCNDISYAVSYESTICGVQYNIKINVCSSMISWIQPANS